MTQKELKEFIENVDWEHGWRLDNDDGYSGRQFWFRNFDQGTVIAEKEEYWRPALLISETEDLRWWAVVHYYFLKGGADADLPLSYFRETKTSVLNRLKEVGRNK